jgi:four helix bundle suffix protein
MRFKALRCASLDDLRGWIAQERKKHGLSQTGTDATSEPAPSAVLVANATLSLLNLCCYLLDRQIESLAKTFEKEGGFTERLYRMCSNIRRNSPD